MALDASRSIEQVRAITERVAGSHGLEVVEVELRGSGKHRMLRIFLDRPEGVTHDDCANVSREVSAILDVEDTVPGGQYLLEVSSPGLDRKLSTAKDFERFQGSLVKLMTREPVAGNRHFEGRLTQFSEGRLQLELSNRKKVRKSAAKDLGKIEGKIGNIKDAPTDKAAAAPTGSLQIELSNVEKANLIPEF